MREYIYVYIYIHIYIGADPVKRLAKLALEALINYMAGRENHTYLGRSAYKYFSSL